MTKIFLTHASIDKNLAIYLKDLLQKYVSGIEIFVSSDPNDLLLGAKWPEKIQQELKESNILLLLATTRSLTRPWVWFECGTFWFSNRPIIPLCTGEVKKNALPTPLSERQALNLEDTHDIKKLIEFFEISNDPSKKPLDISLVVEQLKKLEQEIANLSLKDIEGWIGVEWNNRFLAYDGPIEGLNLIDDEVFQISIMHALESAGFKVRIANTAMLSYHFEKGYRKIYLTDRKTWRREIKKEYGVLIAKPEGIGIKK